MNRETLEYQLTAIFFNALVADEDITEKELNQLSASLPKVFSKLGIKIDGDIEVFLGDCFEDFNQIEEEQMLDLLVQAVENLSSSLSKEDLEFIYKSLEGVAGADVLSEHEKQIIQEIKTFWKLD